MPVAPADLTIVIENLVSVFNFMPLPFHWLGICHLLFQITLDVIGLIDRPARDELIVSVKELNSFNRRR